MKAAVYPGAGKPISIDALPDPEPGPDDVIIKVHRCGICGTDLHMTEGHQWQFPAGCVPGHEYAGEIVELGANVTGLRKGDRITALPSTGCGKCEACARGNLALCHASPGVMGGFAEYNRVPASVAIKLPSALSLADGALIEPLATCLHGVRLARLTPGDRVLVLGAGAIGLCAIYWARRLGAGKIVALSRSDRRKQMALDMGADAFIAHGDNETEDVVGVLGGPPDAVFECVGAPGFVGKSIQHAKVLGRVVSLGFCTAPDPISPAAASYKGISIHFIVGYTLKEFRYIADIMDKGHVDPKILISNEIPLAGLPGMFAHLRGPNQETKVHVTPE
jgi:2-desacetyl-2-hydroxyethyl bacteriochlorophyllide A dehydrogenase